MALLEEINLDMLLSTVGRIRTLSILRPDFGDGSRCSVCLTPCAVLLVHVDLNSALKKQNSMIKI